MNKENLLRAADYIETIPQDRFDMYQFRTGQKRLAECDSVGCIIGHCTVLDKENNMEHFINLEKEINFYNWSQCFFGIDDIYKEWAYLFGHEWTYSDNTPTGAAARIRHFIEQGLPKDWAEQMYGTAPLSYKTEQK